MDDQINEMIGELREEKTNLLLLQEKVTEVALVFLQRTKSEIDKRERLRSQKAQLLCEIEEIEDQNASIRNELEALQRKELKMEMEITKFKNEATINPENASALTDVLVESLNSSAGSLGSSRVGESPVNNQYPDQPRELLPKLDEESEGGFPESPQASASSDPTATSQNGPSENPLRSILQSPCEPKLHDCFTPDAGTSRYSMENFSNLKKNCLFKRFQKHTSPNLSPYYLRPFNHQFKEKKIKKPNECCICKEELKLPSFGLKCRKCKLVCHSTCKENISGLCFPRSPKTPRSPFSKSKKFFEYPVRPGLQVPGILVDCITEIDRRRCSTTFSLYSFLSNPKDAEKLKARLLEGQVDWAKVNDTHVVCTTVLYFLWALKEPILPRDSFLNMIIAIKAPTDEKVNERISEEVRHLPVNVRDTIAFIVIHLQKVKSRAELHRDVKSKELLAAKFASGVISKFDYKEESEKRQLSVMIMTRLWDLSTDFWQECFKNDSSSIPCQA